MMGQARAENAQRVWGIDGPCEQCGEEGRSPQRPHGVEWAS